MLNHFPATPLGHRRARDRRMRATKLKRLFWQPQTAWQRERLETRRLSRRPMPKTTTLRDRTLNERIIVRLRQALKTPKGERP